MFFVSKNENKPRYPKTSIITLVGYPIKQPIQNFLPKKLNEWFLNRSHNGWCDNRMGFNDQKRSPIRLNIPDSLFG